MNLILNQLHRERALREGVLSLPSAEVLSLLLPAIRKNRIPEDMELLIGEFCWHEIALQQSSLKAEYIGANVDNIRAMLKSFSKLRLYKTKTRITNVIFKRNVDINKLAIVDKHYKNTTKNGIIDIINSLLYLSLFDCRLFNVNKLIEDVKSDITVEIDGININKSRLQKNGIVGTTKKMIVQELVVASVPLNDLYKLVKGIEYQYAVYNK